uniref:ORF 107 protein n=1 Tax=Saccharomyces cerevisiae TaxID=4932 RepID=A2NY36_YEASX|nr:ORF 107 [Saccharomyces cerevisiae]
MNIFLILTIRYTFQLRNNGALIKLSYGICIYSSFRVCLICVDNGSRRRHRQLCCTTNCSECEADPHHSEARYLNCSRIVIGLRIPFGLFVGLFSFRFFLSFRWKNGN